MDKGDTIIIMELSALGFELIDKCPRYGLFSANCQTFVMSFLEAISEKDENSRAIEEAFRRECIGFWIKPSTYSAKEHRHNY